MENKTLLNVALISSLLGLLLLSFISDNLSSKQYNISSITRTDIDKDVKVIGKVVSINFKDNTAFLKLKDESGQINVVIFNPQKAIKPASIIEVQGKVNLYRNNLEIIAKKIKIEAI